MGKEELLLHQRVDEEGVKHHRISLTVDTIKRFKVEFDGKKFINFWVALD
jgi:hypothetical protein